MPFLLFPFGLDKFYHILVKFYQINQLVLQKFSFEYEKIYLSCKETLGRTQVNKVMKLYDSKKANIVLAHNPDVCDLDIWNNYKGWILSGHTHGGQVKPPFVNPPILPVKNKKYTAGIIDLSNERTLYINRALGHLWQVRFNVRPEITVFELLEG